ncbi:unnamed protein product, partial [Rotaria sp. Silwood1]
MEYLPYPDDNFNEIIDNCFQRGDKFTLEHIRRRTGQAFVPNVRVHVKSIVAKRTDKCSTAFIDPYLFCITAQHGLNKWTIYKRYRHFQDLHQTLMNFVNEERKKSNNDLDMYGFFNPTKKNNVVWADNRSDANECGRLDKMEKYPVSIIVVLGVTCIQDKNNEYPYFPATNDQTPLTNDSIIEERCRILVDYFNKVLRHPKFRAHPAMREFFNVSCLSFIHGLSVSRKEGYLSEASIDYYCDQHVLFPTQYLCNLCKCHDGPKWFIIKDSYIVDIRPDTHEVYFPMLVDRGFQVSTVNDNNIKISNLQRTLVIKCRTTYDCNEWTQDLLNLIEQANDFVSTKQSRFNSYASVRENQLAYWFINGKSYMKAVAKALLTAKDEVFITDWWLSPELLLIRPTDDETYRLDNILGRIADAGVRVYVMLFKEISFAVALNSLYTKKTLVSKSTKGFIKVIRHPDRNTTDGVLLWSHHEKMVVIDQKIAFVGGIDLCYGRWDDEYMRLVDLGKKNDTTLKSPFDIAAEKAASGGKETVEAAQITTTQMAEQAGEIPIKCEKYLKNDLYPYLLPKSYDDVEDLTIENWRDFLESEPFRVNAQCVRSVGPWSARTKTIESSIQNAYIQMIDAAKHYIYIENQFFVSIAHDSVVRNQLGDVLFRRIERAHKNNEKFRIYIVLPLLPGFDSMNTVQAVLYFIMRSIVKGDNSLFKRLENA